MVAPVMFGLPIVAQGLRGLLLGALLGGAVAAHDTYLRWSRRHDWDHYAWFLETFLNARLLSYDSRPF